jgi:cystathionine beta-lyase/cystathionine gamma-synthase
VVSLEIAGGAGQAARFADSLQYFSIAASVGSTESLIMPPQLLGGGEFNAEQRAASLLRPGTVRLSIGLEDASDLIDDLDQALQRAGG